MSTTQSYQVLALDVDQTVLHGDTNKQWLDFLYRHQYVTDPRYRRYNEEMLRNYHAGKLIMRDYLRGIVPMLAPFDAKERERIVQEFTIECLLPIVYPAAKAVIARAKKHQVPVVLISATCSYLLQDLGRHLGADTVIGIDLEEIDGRFTGRIAGVASFREGKVTRLAEYLDTHKQTFENVLFYTDSHNDMPLAMAVGEVRLVNPDPRLRKAGEMFDWVIESWTL